MKRHLVHLALAATLAVSAMAASPVLPLTQHGGKWPAGHVQGIAVDVNGGYIYYSFTTLLAKYDFSGKLIGTIENLPAHMGDMDFNPDDGLLYASFENLPNQAYYVTMIDGSKIDRVGIDLAKTDIFHTVYIAEILKDYLVDLNHDGKITLDYGKNREDEAKSPDHRYGVAGFDGVGFGPAFGRTAGPRYLTLAYGIYNNLDRTDNDHQVLLQYDVSNWAQYARPFRPDAPHRSGPPAPHGKYFVRTGHTTWGVQNLSYDESLQRWFLGVYQGKKKEFPNYLLFAVDASTQPVLGDLLGVPGPGGQDWEQGLLLALADDGLKDPATGIRGWNQKADVGFQSVGGGLFYLSKNSGGKDAKGRGWQSADLTLMRWTGEANRPFVPATAADLPPRR
ncbi:MAG TPA: hypothetical protein PLQ52_07860 [Lacunisphaera sp.]|jgi:hypothetical protein|nr:hypothetical protein [Lacunisphaera sp.]HQY05966.1 hypothetical protein [Lacunisphaera sp.]